MRSHPSTKGLATLLTGLALLIVMPLAATESAILAVGVGEAGASTGVSPTDLAALSSSGALEIVEVGPVGGLTGSWEVVVYVDQELTGTRSILRYLESLAGNSQALAALGEVQLILAGIDRSTVVRSADPSLLEEVLFQQSLRSEGVHGIREVRTELLAGLETEGIDPAELTRAAIALELEILRRRSDELVHWVSSQGRGDRPRALFFLSEALGADMLAFYDSLVDDPRAAIADAGGPPDLEELARILASYGWALFPTVVPPADDEEEDRLSLRTNRSIGFRLKLGGRNQQDGEEAEPEVDLRLDEGRSASLTRLAEMTGGQLAASLDEIPAIVADLSSRRALEIVLPDGLVAPLPIELTSRDPGVVIRAPGWAGGHPEAVAEVRIRRALEGDADPGELPLRARILLEAGEQEHAELDLAVDHSEVPASQTTRLRVSVGVHLQSGELVMQHQVFDADPASEPTFSLVRPIDLPASTDAAIVVVENLDQGGWGENFAEFVTRTAAVAEANVPEVAPARPAGPALLLEPLPANARSGKVRIRTRTRGDVYEVVFLVDGERVGRKRRSPFDLRVDLGKVPEQRSIIAIAYDSSGAEIGRDGLVVNEAATNFWVQISEPRPSDRVGPVDVVTSFRLPEEALLEKMDFYWNDELIATTRQDPHRQRLLIPVDNPAGYIRVVATLTNGKTAEDVVLMNTQRFESEVLVELVELYIVVTDPNGKPVHGLDRMDFVIREEQEVQDVESFAIAGDLPLTLGLAIDSSLSLFKKLPEVQTAATGFVESLKADRDRAFLIGYGSQPRLVQAPTSELDRIVDGIDSLQASGNTAVWEAVNLSLDQLRETTGRKALVVFYDGDDEDENFSFKKALDAARKSRIPIYLIVMNNEAARTQGKGFSVRSRIARLDQLARTGGGRVFYVRTDQDLSPIFAQISEELRSHYLLTYYPQRPVEEPEWRPISVELTRPDLTARTISGYGGG